MEAFIFLAYELLVSLLPAWRPLPFWSFGPGKARRGNSLRMTLLLCFVLYLVAVYHVTGVGTLYDGLLYQGKFGQNRSTYPLFPRH